MSLKKQSTLLLAILLLQGARGTETGLFTFCYNLVKKHKVIIALSAGLGASAAILSYTLINRHKNKRALNPLITEPVNHQILTHETDSILPELSSILQEQPIPQFFAKVDAYLSKLLPRYTLKDPLEKDRIIYENLYAQTAALFENELKREPVDHRQRIQIITVFMDLQTRILQRIENLNNQELNLR